MPHISYFINTYTFKGFLKSLISLPGHNARGLTSKQSHKVPWGDQYRVDGVYSVYNRQTDTEEYDEYDCYFDDEDYEEQVVEHLSHQGWVRL